MFGSINFGHLPPAPEEAERQLLPATPIKFPRLLPKPPGSRAAQASGPAGPLVELLQSLIRPTDIRLEHFEALGLHVTPGAGPVDIFPDPSLVPDFAEWEKLTPDDAREKNQEVRRPLSNGSLSPGCQVYLDRKRELSYANEDAFRTVRRAPPTMGQPPPRLGNSYEFFRCLELLTSYWDDPTGPPKNRPPLRDGPPPDTSSPAQPNAPGGSGPSPGPSTASRNAKDLGDFWPTGIGAAMSNQTRQSLLSSFLKLVAYDFGCNISAAKTEPRLQLVSQPPAADRSSQKKDALPPRRSYFATGCLFVFRSPTTRDAARAGVVEGPLGAVSARQTVVFKTEEDDLIDLAREVVAALVTAQHRARYGRQEARPGEGEWWTTTPRWGGGTGGPIGREIDRDDVAGDKDALGVGMEGEVAAAAAAPTRPGGSGPSPGPGPLRKRPKKTLSVYDSYRMVRPPSANWDAKARYQPIGRQAGTDYDDIFVFSSLFHHISIARVRVPDRLVAVLEGALDDGEAPSWGGLRVWRSRWFDFFVPDDRVEAMRMVWGVMSYLMRKDTGREEDAEMVDA